MGLKNLTFFKKVVDKQISVWYYIKAFDKKEKIKINKNKKCLQYLNTYVIINKRQGYKIYLR